MPKNRKFFPHNAVLLISARTEEGLPMPPNHIMNYLIWGILAEARSKYQLRVCHFIFMANHLHMIAVVDNPEDVSSFMRYLKAETSHAINRLLGRFKRTIWSEGYDSPLLLTPERVIHYIKYIYLNPVKASLVEDIAEYPGVSSWEMFVSKMKTVKGVKVPRSSISSLWTASLSVSEQKKIVGKWESLGINPKKFTLEPWAWLEAFPEFSRQEVRERILREINQEQLEYKKARLQKGIGVLGVTALRRQSMVKPYTPKKRSRRMIVLSEDKELRKRFIEYYKFLCSLAREVYLKWKTGDLTPKIPPGLFSPKVPTLASALPT